MYKQFIIPTFSTITWWIITLLLIWSTVWKGIALWKSAQKKDITWFIALLVLNTMGILEILYIFVFSKQNQLSNQNKIKNQKE